MNDSDRLLLSVFLFLFKSVPIVVIHENDSRGSCFTCVVMFLLWYDVYLHGYIQEFQNCTLAQACTQPHKDDVVANLR